MNAVVLLATRAHRLFGVDESCFAGAFQMTISCEVSAA